jgi:hypothetical protein
MRGGGKIGEGRGGEGWRREDRRDEKRDVKRKGRREECGGEEKRERRGQDRTGE